MTDDATRHNQAAHDRIAGLYAERQAGLSRSFADLTAAFIDRLPPPADVEFQVLARTEESASRDWVKVLART